MLRVLLAVMVLVLCGPALAASTAQQLTWEELVPEGPPIPDPFSSLTPEQQSDLGTIANSRFGQGTQGFSVWTTDTLLATPDVKDLRKKLERQGLNVDRLLAQLDELVAEVDRRNELVVGALDGRTVRLPGYALPLESSSKGVTEFLLVPYVGACIHVPPPPANQMVLVRTKKPFAIKDLYAPVWVTGRMQVAKSTNSLDYVDGRSEVVSGYRLEESSVEAYREPRR